MDCWLDPFKNPSPDAKVTKNPFCNRYDETSHRLTHHRTIATLDSIVEGINGLIRRLKAIGDGGGEDVTIRMTDVNKLRNPSFITLLLNTNRTLQVDHRKEFSNRGFQKIFVEDDIREGLLELWMRRDCLIKYHSPLYRGTCTTNNYSKDQQWVTTEPVRRDISLRLECIRRTLLILRNEYVGGPDEPNMVEAYFVRLLASKGLHSGEYTSTAVWKHYVLNYFKETGGVDCFLFNRLPKTVDGAPFAFVLGS
jgi:hypothetical protein